MQLLARVALPEPAASMLALRHPQFIIIRCVNQAFGLGLVLPLLARSQPFSRAPLGLRVPLTAGELSRGHHLLVVEGTQPVGYLGWSACTLDQGRRYLGQEGLRALDQTATEGEAIALQTVAALSPAASSVLRTAMRALHPGSPYFGRRVSGTGPQDANRIARQGIIRPLAGAAADGT